MRPQRRASILFALLLVSIITAALARVDDDSPSPLLESSSGADMAESPSITTTAPVISTTTTAPSTESVEPSTNAQSATPDPGSHATPAPRQQPSTPSTVASNPNRIGARTGFAEGGGLLWRSDDELTRELDGIAATGATWLRLDVDWSHTERNRGSYDWTAVDRVVDAARARGLRVLGLLAYTPEWARPPGTSAKTPPIDPRDFAQFAAAASARYAGRGITAWEIWNEPNHRPFWQPAPSAAGYTALLQAAYPAIKAASPAATVVTAGLSPAPNAADGSAVAPATFLAQMYQAGAHGYFDAVGLHPSTFPAMPTRQEPDPNWNAFSGVAPAMHDLMAANGDGDRRIWATEMGAPTHGGLDADFLAAYASEAVTNWVNYSFAGPLFWYSYVDAPGNAASVEAHFGLTHRDFSPKGDALRVFTSAMGQPAPPCC